MCFRWVPNPHGAVTDQEMTLLQDLAAMVMDQIELQACPMAASMPLTACPTAAR